MDLQAGKEYTFKITETPIRSAHKKTLSRLMHLQADRARGLKALQKQRRQKDNRTYVRAGRPWTDRAKATRLARPEEGESFTITVTPQLIPDIQSVEKFIDAS